MSDESPVYAITPVIGHLHYLQLFAIIKTLE